MKVHRKVAVAGAVLMAVGIGGAGSASALTLVTPNGKTVVAPDAAVPGAVNAWQQVVAHTDEMPIQVAP